jgi:uncharacterized protein (TIGR04255 family)
MRSSVRRWYAEPAIVEAVFEIRAAAAAPWDDDSYARMSARFPGFSGEQYWVDGDAPTSRYGLAPPTPAQHPTGGMRRLYRANPERTRAIQFGPRLCAYHALKPYGHYEDHVMPVQRLVDAYLAEEHPTVIGGAQQHYVNEFRVARRERPSALFTFYPPLPEELQREHAEIHVEVAMHSFADGATSVRLRRVAVDNASATYHLEVIARSVRALEPDADALTRWQNLAHVALNHSFELSITAECRKRLRQV